MLGGVNIVNKKIKNIEDIFKISNITDDYILTRENNNYYKIYIYELEPIILLNPSDNIKEKIVCEYKEFLRQITFDFQILAVNKQVQFSDYINQIKNSNICNTHIYNEYVKDMELKFANEDIYETSFYIIVKLENNECLNVENVDNSFKILDKIGCKIKKIQDKQKIQKILNKAINKEW